MFANKLTGSLEKKIALTNEPEATLLTPYAHMLESKHGKFKGNAIMANKLGRAVYFMLQKGTVFDAELIV